MGWIYEALALLGQLNWGSVADWVSGIGSIGAAVTALYLAGSERRARAIADRPHVKVEVSECNAGGWVSVGLKIENGSRLHWRMTAIQAVRPTDARVVDLSETYRSNEEKPWEAPVSDDELRQKNLARRIKCSVEVQSAGTPGSASNDYRPRDTAYYTFLVNMPSRARALKLKLHFSSLEPIANDFTQLIVRKWYDVS